MSFNHILRNRSNEKIMAGYWTDLTDVEKTKYRKGETTMSLESSIIRVRKAGNLICRSNVGMKYSVVAWVTWFVPGKPQTFYGDDVSSVVGDVLNTYRNVIVDAVDIKDYDGEIEFYVREALDAHNSNVEKTDYADWNAVKVSVKSRKDKIDRAFFIHSSFGMREGAVLYKESDLEVYRPDPERGGKAGCVIEKTGFFPVVFVPMGDDRFVWEHDMCFEFTKKPTEETALEHFIKAQGVYNQKRNEMNFMRRTPRDFVFGDE